MSGFSKTERDAMKQRAEELRATKGVKGAAKKAKELEACVAAIDALSGFDRELSERFHVVVSEEAPELDPKTFYGFPSYARDGKVIMFVQPSSKFDTRYPTVNFDDGAHLDDGVMWPTSFAVLEWTEDVEKTLRTLVRKAVS
ncbi:hypothetical protein [Pseudactinotalea suaedae]|jgi:uncharacterized protein YdhG (YjbR/CyaY superfamily)|uniref:hypothetical protein n=1 Tax=Pseudactinotalea suaedae TaxID=1524924 RepID=UPI0012E22FB9|nr:hypothetical protein [Pseudactinotalea suaedae]